MTQKILFMILDSVVIALILLLVAYKFNRLLERSKAKLAFGNEMAKLRVARIGEVWVALAESEAASRELLKEAMHVIDEQGNNAAALRALLPMQQKSKEKAAIVQQVADANRFWLCETQYEKIRCFHNNHMDMLEAVGKNDLSALIESKTRLNKARMSICSFTSSHF